MAPAAASSPTPRHRRWREYFCHRQHGHAPERRNTLSGDIRHDATATGGTITVDATNTVTMNSASITAKQHGSGGCRQHRYHRDQRLDDAEQYHHDRSWAGGRRRQYQSDHLSSGHGVTPTTASSAPRSPTGLEAAGIFRSIRSSSFYRTARFWPRRRRVRAARSRSPRIYSCRMPTVSSMQIPAPA